jgi:hypothetical protein
MFTIASQTVLSYSKHVVVELDERQIWQKIRFGGNTFARTWKGVASNVIDVCQYGFTRTRVPVSLARYEDENLVSRSQAKRLLVRFDRFKEVILDFEGVEMIGQAFADEVFRILSQDHPEINLQVVNTTDRVKSMILRALAR